MTPPLGKPELAVDKDGNVYVSGRFTDSCDFDPGDGVFNLAPTTSEGIFLVKFDTNGGFVWVKAVSGTNPTAKDIAIDKRGNVYQLLSFTSLAKLGPDAGGGDGKGVSGDHHLEKRKPNGKRIWHGIFGALTGDAIFNGLAVDKKFKVHLSGQFNGTLEAERGPAETVLTAQGDSDGALIKLKVPKKSRPISARDTVAAESPPQALARHAPRTARLLR